MMKVTGWWFSKGYTLPHGDGREIKIGITHKVKGEIELCRNGLHFSENILDALKYAPGTVVWRVEGSGTIVRGDDKVACSERTYLAGGIDVSDVLRKFARMCALDVIDLWDAPDIVVKYLKTGDESIRDAAWDAAWAAVRDATWDAARAAAWAAAGAAAWAAAWDAALRKKQARRLTRMINEAIKEDANDTN